METKIILEFGCNHQGSIVTAKHMIDEAEKLGVWGVKFQKRDIDAFPEELKNKVRDIRTSFGNTYYEHRKVLEFNPLELLDLMIYAEKKGIRFICSAFDEKSLIDLTKIGCEYIKLPSQLYSDKDMYNLAMTYKKAGFKFFVSTGMHTNTEIFSNEWLHGAAAVMHCTSVYPHTIFKTNLRVLQNLCACLNCTVGYSSHELQGEAVHFAVLAGATVIERHYTLDKTMKGSDHSTVSSDFAEMANIINNVQIAEDLLGNNKNDLSDDEKKTRKIYRGF